VIHTCFKTGIRSAAPPSNRNVARAEQQNDLVQRRIRANVDQLQPVRPQRYSRQQEDRDVGNPDLLGDEPRDRADRKNQSATEQRVLGDLD